MELTKENLIAKAKEYGLEISFDKEPGFYVGSEKIEVEELFEEIIPELKELK